MFKESCEYQELCRNRIAGKLAIFLETRAGNMSLAENTYTVSKYNWGDLSAAVVKDYATTVYKESHRLPDDWTFLIKEDGLFDIKRDGYVRDIVKDYPHPNLYLRKLEDQIIEVMDSWAVSDSQNSLSWISPSFAGEYPCHKIEILQKWPDSSGTNNVAVLFDCDNDTCLELAKRIFPELKAIQDVEELRNSVVIGENLDFSNVFEIIKPYILKSEDLKEIPKEHFDYIADLVQRGIGQMYIAHEMERLGMIGEQSFSCSGSGLGLASILGKSSLNLNGAEDQYGPLEFTCPHCHEINRRPLGQLISNCQHCGKDVRC